MNNVNVHASIPNYSDETAHNFTVITNIIGYQWKSYNGSNYTIEDSTAYILRDQTDTYWKIVMTGFEGGATGKIHFNKLKLGKGVSINTINQNLKLQLFPNPATENSVHLIAECAYSKEATVTIVDMTGKVLYKLLYRFNEGMNALELPIQQLSNGMYFVNIHMDGTTMNQKFIKQ